MLRTKHLWGHMESAEGGLRAAFLLVFCDPACFCGQVPCSPATPASFLELGRHTARPRGVL